MQPRVSLQPLSEARGVTSVPIEGRCCQEPQGRVFAWQPVEVRNLAFEAVVPPLTGIPSLARTSRKRSLDSSDKGVSSDEDDDDDDSEPDIDVSGALNGLGYMSHHHHLVLGYGPGPKVE